MKTVTHKQAVWLHEPAMLAQLNLESGHAVAMYTTTTGLGLDMTSSGWLKLGEVEHTYTIDLTPEEAVAAAVQSMHAKINELEEEHNKKVTAIREGIAKLQAIGYTPPAAEAAPFDEDIPF